MSSLMHMKIKLMDSLTASNCLTCLHIQRADVANALVEETINSLNYGKTAGMDVFPYKFYKIFKETLSSLSCATFTMVLNMVITKDIWHDLGWDCMYPTSFHLSAKAFPEDLNLFPHY